MSRKGKYLSILLFLLLCLSPADSSPVQAHPQTLIQVTTTADVIDQDGTCSLREAVQAANTDTQVDSCPAGSGDDTIYLPAGLFSLTLIGPTEDDGLTGDIDIQSNLTFYGSGIAQTVIDGHDSDRVFHIFSGATVNFHNLTIQGGKTPAGPTEGRGGGILNVDGNLSLFRIKIISNEADWTGGGVDNTYGTLTLSEVIIVDNRAAMGGGVNNSRYMLASRSLITANQATISGGGIDNNTQGQASLLNLTLSGNVVATGGNGGGIYTDRPIQLANVTIVQNSPNGLVDKVSVRMVNTLFSQNGAANCAGDRLPDSEGNNLSDDDSCGSSGFINVANALIGDLADNNGPTFTHLLLPGSPAIDAGNDTSCQHLDQRGAIRPADGNGDDLAVCDIGALELNAIFTDIYLPVILH